MICMWIWLRNLHIIVKLNDKPIPGITGKKEEIITLENHFVRKFLYGKKKTQVLH